MIKRIFDIVFSVLGLVFTGWIIIIFIIITTVDTGQSGIYTQIRIGKNGKRFRIYKLRTLKPDSSGNFKVSALGNFLRKSKIDELPQLYNIIINNMSFVGPRPDIPGYYDRLEGNDRILLELKPGITGPASIKYSDEEKLLLSKENPEKYNDEVVFPDKVRINLKYHQHWSFALDLKIILYTILRKKLKENYFN